MKKGFKMFLAGISPTLTTQLLFYHNFKRFANLKKPRDINEKLQYLKLKVYTDNPVITECVDKYRVRNYLAQKGYDKLCAKLIGGGYLSAEDIRKYWKEYPRQFVIKCNHGCGYNILVPDKAKANLDNIIKKLNVWLKEDYWKIYCEPQYKNVPKCIIVEEYLADNIQTYKFYCFNGKPEVVYVSSNGEKGEKDLYLDYFDMNWNHMPISLKGHLNSKRSIEMPKNFEKMIEVAESLSDEFPFVRVDLYNVDGKIFFSELTFIPTGGMMRLCPENIIEQWGRKLKL